MDVTFVALLSLLLLQDGGPAQTDAGVSAPTGTADAGAAGAQPRLTRAPAVRTPPRPRYPGAVAGAPEVAVQLEVDIDATGAVTAARVVGSAGPEFDAEALAAVQAMDFFPAEVDGRPSPLRFRYLLRIRPPLPDAAPGGAPPLAPPSPAPSSPPPAAGQPPPLVLRGLVRERGTRAPVVAAEVTVTALAADGTASGPGTPVAETDPDGRFEVRAAAGAGGLRVVVAGPGHQPCVRVVAPAELGAVLDWSCLTGAREGPSYETVVTTTRRPEQPREQLAGPEVRSVPGTMGDPLRAVQSLPGVARPPFGTGLLVVRGASPADSGVFLDGLAVPVLYHFLVGPSVLPANLIGDIEFFPGGFGVRYGRLTAGAIEVHSRSPATAGRRVQGAAELSPLDASMLVAGPVGQRSFVTLAVRRSAIDLILPALVPERPGTSFTTAVPAYWDYQARLEHTLAGGQRLRLFLFGSDDRLDIVTADPNRRFQLNSHIGFHRAALTLTTQHGRWTSRLAPAYGYGDESFAASSDEGYLRNHRLYLREELERSFGRRLELALGFDGLFSYDWGRYDFSFPREGRTFGATKPEHTLAERAFVDILPALWIEARWQVTERLRVTPGLRGDSYFVLDTSRHSVDPRLAVHYQAGARVGLRAGAGLYHQLVAPRYFDAEFGNPDLDLVRAVQAQVGADVQLGPAVRASATAFALRRSRIPVPSPQRFSSLGRARAHGLELMLRHRLHRHFYGWLAYTLSRAEQNADFAEEIEQGLASPRGAPQDEAGGRPPWRPATFDQTHNLVAVASYRRGAWELGARYRLVTGRPSTPIRGAFADLDFGAYTPERAAAYSGRRPGFSQLDLRVERSFTFDLFQLGAYLDVQNALNAENPEDTLYDYRYRESVPVRGLPILPLLGLRGSF